LNVFMVKQTGGSGNKKKAWRPRGSKYAGSMVVGVGLGWRGPSISAEK